MSILGTCLRYQQFRKHHTFQEKRKKKNKKHILWGRKPIKQTLQLWEKRVHFFWSVLYVQEKFHLGKEGVCVQGGSNYNQAFALTGDFHRFLAHLQ